MVMGGATLLPPGQWGLAPEVLGRRRSWRLEVSLIHSQTPQQLV